MLRTVPPQLKFKFETANQSRFRQEYNYAIKPLTLFTAFTLLSQVNKEYNRILEDLMLFHIGHLMV